MTSERRTAIFWRTTIGDRNLSSISQAGLVNNLNDGMAWGLFPLFFAAASMSLERTAALAAIYPATWGLVQLGTGALSDRIGRKWLIATGMWTQAGGIAVTALSETFFGFAVGAVLARRRHRDGLPDAPGRHWRRRRSRPGAHQRSASIGSGEISAMPSAPSSPA